jgi:hypothetical protein
VAFAVVVALAVVFAVVVTLAPQVLQNMLGEDSEKRRRLVKTEHTQGSCQRA